MDMHITEGKNKKGSNSKITLDTVTVLGARHFLFLPSINLGPIHLRKVSHICQKRA